MRSVTIFVASPGDVAAERAAVREVADQLNRQMDGERGVRLEVRTYETDARHRLDPDGPQAVVNKDMPVEQHDIVIGIFWMRFGTPIPHEGGQTGSEYEIRRALAHQSGDPRKPEITVFFSKAPPADLFRIDIAELTKVNEFRQELEQKGLTPTYTDLADFKKKLADYLWHYLRQHHPLQRLDGQTASTADPSEYLAQLEQETANIEVRGLKVGDPGAWFLPIDEYYIPLTSASRPLSSEVEQHRKLLIVGDPGSGKSTFLRWLANRLCREYAGRAPVPVLLSAAALAKFIAGPHTGSVPAEPHSPEWLLLFLAAQCREKNRGLSIDDFRNLMKQGRCRLLLDGFDETPDERGRHNIAKLVKTAADSYRQCSFVVTSRPEGKVAIAGFEERQIADLPPETVRWFVDKLSGFLYAKEPEKADMFRRDLERANTSRAVRKLARNPVMLSALAVLQHNNVRLPERRVDLYESVLDWLAKARQKDGRLSADECLLRLRELALAMQSEPEGRAKRVRLAWAGNVLSAKFGGRERAERFLREEQKDSGIVVSRGDELEYWHLTFQEYLAAREIAGKPDSEQFEKILGAKVLSKPEWRETVLLYVGLLRNQGGPKVHAFLAKLLDTLGDNPSLADRARVVGLVGAMLRDLDNYQPTDERYAESLRLVMDIFDPEKSKAVPFDHRLAAAEALGQAGDPRLVKREWVDIPETNGFWMGAQSKDPSGRNYDREALDDYEPVRQIDVPAFRIAKYPVTVSEYLEFMEEGGYTKPEFWTAGGFGKTAEPEQWLDQQEHPNRPVMGVNQWEAMAFANWVGGRARLPTDQEWERAARAPASAKYPWGNDAITPDRANYRDSNIGYPTPVGLYPTGVSKEGALDLIGNVWEWTASPHEARAGAFVVRGGSCYNESWNARAAYRNHDLPDVRARYLGFRLAQGIT